MATQFVTRQFADSAITNAKLAGSITTANLADGAEFLQRDGSVTPTADLPMGGFKITGLGVPTADGDAATKSYTDSVAQGLDVKASSRAATVQGLALDSTTPSYDPVGGTATRGQLTFGTGPTAIDTVTLANDDRILVKNEVSTQEITDLDFTGSTSDDISGGYYVLGDSSTTTVAYWFNTTGQGSSAPAGHGADRLVEVPLSAGAADNAYTFAIVNVMVADPLWSSGFGAPTYVGAVVTANGPTGIIPDGTLDGVIVGGTASVSLTVTQQGNSAAVNGIWVRTSANTWDRATDFDQDTEVTSAAFTFIEEGTLASSGWVLSTADPVTIGGASGSDILFVQFSDAAAVSGGDGINIAGSIVSVDLLASGGLKISGIELAVEPTDFAGTGLEDDGADNLRLATQGTGIAGGNGSTLSFDATAADGNGLSGTGAVLTVVGGTAGADVVAVTVTASGVGFDVAAIDGNGLAANGSGVLDVVGGTAGADVVAVTVTASGVGFNVASIDGDGLLANGSGVLNVDLAATPGLEFSTGQLRLSAQGTGIAGGAGSTLSFDATAADGDGLSGTGAVLSLTLLAQDDITATFALNGVDAVGVLGQTPYETGTDQHACFVFVNGQLMQEGTTGGSQDYYIVGTAITFTAGNIPDTGDKIICYHFA